MIKNYISENISFLVSKLKFTQDDFGDLFDVNRGLINNYVNKKSLPKIETLIKIADYFKISLDDLILKDLSENKSSNMVNEPRSSYGKEPENSDVVAALKEVISAKDETIQALKEQIEQYKSTAGKAASAN